MLVMRLIPACDTFYRAPIAVDCGGASEELLVGEQNTVSAEEATRGVVQHVTEIGGPHVSKHTPQSTHFCPTGHPTHSIVSSSELHLPTMVSPGRCISATPPLGLPAPPGSGLRPCPLY
jgi:hypothetical protein